MSGPYISLTLLETWRDENRWKQTKGEEMLTYGEREEEGERESVGEMMKKIVVGELRLSEGHN